MRNYYILFFFLFISSISKGQDLIITGVIDGPLSGSTPKAIELYATADIADLSLYEIGSANNGGGSDGHEFSLSGSASNGDFIYVASEVTQFTIFFGFSPNFTSGFANISGDDAIELYYDALGLYSGGESVIDVFGEISHAGGSLAWDYDGGWAYRNNATGPDGSTFTIANWSFDELSGSTTNADETTPFPTGTYSLVAGDNSPPVWSPSFPYLDNLAATSFDIFGQIDEPGTIFYVVIPNDAVAPSSAQVVAGSAPGATLFSGSIPVVTGLSTVSTSVTGLVEGLDYDVYVVAQDDEGTPNVQAVPIKLNFPPELIAITEFINDPNGADADYEWIELFNYGANDVDLTNWTISDDDGLEGTIGSIVISAGDYVILAKNKLAFETRWLGLGTSDARVIQLSGIALVNTVDEIILSDSDGNDVWSLEYVDDESEGLATFLGYNENSSSTIFTAIDRDDLDGTGTTGYEDTGDALAYSADGDTGSPLDGEYAQPLPVELVNFEGFVDQYVATLEWQTMSEINNSGFQIEKSYDGIKFFEVGLVKGNGDSNELINYSFIDQNFNSSSYFRLRQIDYNGIFELSEIIFLRDRWDTKQNLISPNPITNDLNIHFQSDNFLLQIMDLSGRILLDEYLSKHSAKRKIASLRTGTYTVRISNAGSSSHQVIIKK